MQQQKRWIAVIGLMTLALSAMPIQADFIQCIIGGGVCIGTINNDLINGTDVVDVISGEAGNDTIFAQDGDDTVLANEGNDLVFGGLGNDLLEGNSGNDIILGGPDAPGVAQFIALDDGADVAYAFAGETTNCLIITDDGGDDTVNLIGFGPFSATLPFGQPGFLGVWVHVVDPIGGGDILIDVFENDDTGIERINGLPSPNVTFIDFFPEGCNPPG